MHKKYFFFDIDGTLSTGLTTMMPESAVKALAQLRANGHFTAIATGRLQASAAAVAARYGFTDIVADGGWSVTHNGEIVEMESLPAADCIALIERLEQAGIPWAVSPENEKLCVTTDKIIFRMHRRTTSLFCGTRILIITGGASVQGLLRLHA